MSATKSVILVVDDNAANLSLLFDPLNQAGYAVLIAKSGESALKRAKNVHPDLILLDVMMPGGIDGFETCRRLKTDAATQDIPVIFMTALNDVESKVYGFEQGGVDYITKPIQLPEVLARVKTHLTLQRLQNELKIKNAMLARREIHLMHLVEAKTQKIENITLALVNALEHANFYNDTETGHHIKRVGAYSAFLAERYGSDRDFVKRIRLYAPLHDVGKVGLPDALLKKAGKYTEQEVLDMQQHVVIGAKLLQNEELDEMARNIALYHHEKWDGSGYVHSLAGEHIPLEARIVAIVDVYDALISARVYKGAFSEEQTLRIIHNESGKHFDPRLVELFLTYSHDINRIHTTFL